MKPYLCVAAALSLFAAAGCSSSDSSSNSTASVLASAPSIPLTTENFSGTVQPGSNDAHNTFNVVSNNFQVTLALTTAGPPATIQEGFGIGQNVAGTCQLLSGGSGTFAASTTPQLSGTIPAGTYCVMVYDVGNQIGPITYTVVVQHY